MNTLEEVQSFLGVIVPSGAIDSSLAISEKLDQSEVAALLPERPPQLYVSKAVALNSNGKNVVLATVPVTEEMCRGHFEWFPMMPLAILAQAAGQAGALLVLLLNREVNSGRVPLAVQVKEVKSVSTKSGSERRDFIVPGDTLLLRAEYIGGRVYFHKAGIMAFVGNCAMASLDEITYVLVEKARFKQEGR